MYQHTFHLIGDEEIVTYSKSQEIPKFNYGDLVTFCGENGKVKMTIPVMSILYVETVEIEE